MFENISISKQKWKSRIEMQRTARVGRHHPSVVNSVLFDEAHAQLFYGSIVALESQDGRFLSVNRFSGAVTQERRQVNPSEGPRTRVARARVCVFFWFSQYNRHPDIGCYHTLLCIRLLLVHSYTC
jgi:hypothetical protein